MLVLCSVNQQLFLASASPVHIHTTGVATALVEIHSSFGLNEDNIIATITDNGLNFVKAFRVFGAAIANLPCTFFEINTFSLEVSDNVIKHGNIIFT